MGQACFGSRPRGGGTRPVEQVFRAGMGAGPGGAGLPRGVRVTRVVNVRVRGGQFHLRRAELQGDRDELRRRISREVQTGN